MRQGRSPCYRCCRYSKRPHKKHMCSSNVTNLEVTSKCGEYSYRVCPGVASGAAWRAFSQHCKLLPTRPLLPFFIKKSLMLTSFSSLRCYFLPRRTNMGSKQPIQHPGPRTLDPSRLAYSTSFCMLLQGTPYESGTSCELPFKRSTSRHFAI